MIQPWDAHARDGATFAALRDIVMGQAVRMVRYVVPRGEIWPEGHMDRRAHEVDMAVEMVMVGGGAVVLPWAMDGVNEGLAIESRDPGEVDVNLPGDAIDVSDHLDWRGLLGISVVDIVPAWHVPNEGCPEMPWAFRFEFANNLGVVVALGAADGDGLAYSPDDLIVIFDEGLAISYKIPARITSSFG